MNNAIPILDKNGINFILFYYSFISPTFLFLSYFLFLSSLSTSFPLTFTLFSPRFHSASPSSSFTLTLTLTLPLLSSSLTHTFSLAKPATSQHHTSIKPRCRISLLIGK